MGDAFRKYCIGSIADNVFSYDWQAQEAPGFALDNLPPAAA